MENHARTTVCMGCLREPCHHVPLVVLGAGTGLHTWLA